MPQLKMFREGAAEASEVLFATEVPLSMVSDVLREKGLYNNGYGDL